jgi:hypothetical protein
MSASREVCREQVLLFRRYHGFPDLESVEGQREASNLIDAFEQYCVSDDHARAVGAELLTTQTYCPKPVDIKSAAQQFHGQFHQTVIGVVCGNACGGSGWIVVEKDGRAAAEYCSCHPGRGSRPQQPAAPKMGFRSAGEVIR